MELKDQGISIVKVITLVASAMLVLVGGIVFLWHSSKSHRLSPRTGSALGAEEKAYLHQFEFSQVRMSAAENFLGDRVTYLDAQVKNKGSRTVRKLDADLTFVDMFGQTVLRETAHLVADRGMPLKPGETKAVRLSFEHMPMEWNQAAPVIVPVFVAF